jgi:DNA-binding SARP family transcriptional activator
VRVRLRILGALEVWDGRAWATVPAARERALLALLVVADGRPVEKDHLIDTLWSGSPPASAARLLPHYVWRLRKLLEAGGAAALHSVPGGYRLDVPPGALDRDLFARHTADGDAAAGRGDAAAALGCWTAALALWRDRALADVPTLPPLAAVADELEAERSRVREARAAALADLGRAGEAVDSLLELTRDDPFRERAWHLLLTALDRAGRRPEAVLAYRRLQQRWTAELGVAPGRELRELYHRLLAGGPDAGPPPGGPDGDPAAPGPVAVRPAQLPPDLPDFTGRDAELAQLSAALAPSGEPGLVPVALVYGPGGAGKSALTARAGHRLAATGFPDGQLYADLRGSGGRPADPAVVLARFLAALGVAPGGVPEEVAERSRLFRSVLAGRRVLVVLDDAADEAQVRPLLPAAGCAALLTGRRTLAGLSGATRIRLGMLPPAESVRLLGRIAGPDRVRAEAAPAAEIARLCGGLPLALRAAGARLAAKPHWSLDRLAARLSDERRRLDELRAGDVEVRASLALGVADLSSAEHETLAAAAAAPAGGFAPWLVAAWCDRPEAEAEDLTERLVDAQLVEPARADRSGQLRYRVHDLTRVLVLEGTPPDHVATARWLRAALALTVRAARGTGDDVRALPAPPVPPDLPATLAAVDRDPHGWLGAERSGLVGAVRRALDGGLVRPGWQLAHALAGYFEVRAAWDDWQLTHETALAAALAEGDRHGEAAMRSGLGRLDLDRNRYAVALDNLRTAAGIARELGLHALLGQTMQWLGQGLQHLNDLDAASGAYAEALELARDAGDAAVQSETLRGMAWIAERGGHRDLATRRLEEALAVLGDRPLALQTPWLLTDLARSHRDAGGIDRAVELLRRAIAVAESFGDHRAAVHALYALGEVLRQAGDLETAHDMLRQAVSTARELRDGHAELLALRRLGLTLDALGRTGPAEEALRDVVTKTAATGRDAMRAVTLLDLAGLYARADRLPDAADALHACIPVFAARGMDDFRERAEAALAGLPVSRATDRDPKR